MNFNRTEILDSPSNKPCQKCETVYPVTRDYFGYYSNKRKRDGVERIGFRNTCRKCMAAHTAAHDKKHPKKAWERRQRRLRRRTSNGGSHTAQDIKRLRKHLQDRCRYCGEQLDGERNVDHMTPLSRGGTDNIGNLTLSCFTCNTEKWKKTADEYIAWRVARNIPTRIVEIPTEQPDKPRGHAGRKRYK